MSVRIPTSHFPPPRFYLFLCALCVLLLFESRAFAQDLTPRSKPQTESVVIVNATIHPVSGPVISKGYIQFNAGRIDAVGPMDQPAAAKAARQIDGAGLHIYPGLIASYNQMGITEMGMSRPSHDFAETGGITPEVYPAVAVNPDSTLIPVARRNGVLASGVFPRGGVVPGRVSVIRHEGWTSEDMTVKADCGLVVRWPMMRTIRAFWMDRSEEDQQKDLRDSLERIREVFATAEGYWARKDAGENPPVDLRWEAMKGVIRGGGTGGKKLPVFIEANEYDQIVAAVSFCAERNLRCVIVGGRDSAMCADLLKKHNARVLITGTYTWPKREDSPHDDGYTLPARLDAAGVKWSLTSAEETPHERNLPYAAARAVAYGLSPEVALRSITLSAAETLGVEESLGSLETGKSATLIITDGDPLLVKTKVLRAFIEGREVDLTSKQTKLAERYREKYAQQKAAGAGK